MSAQKDYMKAQKATADGLWDELKLADKDAGAIADALSAHYDTEKYPEALTAIFTLCLGETKTSKQSFAMFCQTFGPIEEKGKEKMLTKIVKELWDGSTKIVHSWFHATLGKPEELLKEKAYMKHGAFLVRFATDAGMLTINRLSLKKTIVAAKSRLENRPEGWYCQEKKKCFPTLQDYFKARGEKPGDGRLLIPVPRPKADKTVQNLYSSTF